MKILNLNQKKEGSEPSQSIITQAVKILQQDGLVIYPTETCYGAGVKATSQPAVDKLLRYKARREGKPISIAVCDQTMAAKYVHLNSTAKNLYSKFLPGPLTVVSKGKNKLAKGVESETNTLGIRIPDYPLIIKIIKLLGRPITTTSANVSYKKRPYSIKDILNNTSRKQQNLIDLIIDAGTLPKNPPSTVVDTTLDDPLILRKGRFRTFPSQPILISKSPQQTKELAQTLMLKNWDQIQKQPFIFLLIGDLGTGKTQFAKGIGKFLNISQPITSPTYTISKEYDYQRHRRHGRFLHLDTWRLQNIQEFQQLQIEKQLKPKNVIVIEWADRIIKPLLDLSKKTRGQVIIVNLHLVKNKPDHRKISISST